MNTNIPAIAHRLNFTMNRHCARNLNVCCVENFL